MGPRHPKVVLIVLIAAATAACGTPSVVPSPTPLPAATSFEEYAVAFCSAWEAMFTAVGNPDTAAGSELSKALDVAVAAKDGAAAEQKAAEMTAELEAGRRSAAAAGGWPPARPTMAQLDRVFVAYEAMTAAKAAVAKGEPNTVDPQAAFEAAGGVTAWTAMFEAYAAIGPERPADVQRCGDLPIAP